jgi:6-phosphofructokinase 1
MAERKKAAFDERITSERRILRDHLGRGDDLPTGVGLVGPPTIPNPASEEKVGTYRSPDDRKAVTADMDIITDFNKLGKPVPSFLEAGPRGSLFHDPQSVRAVIVTSGGIAPGLNCVVHSIVTRHWNTYSINEARRGGIFGIYDGFVGLYNRPLDETVLKPEITEHWLDRGGSMLGARRFPEKEIGELTERIQENLELNNISILYVIGGDGSLTVAHEIAKRAKNMSVVGIPKTMDNDVLWVWQSFGFNTAVEKATEVVNTMHSEAESTRRVCIIELFGAESGFVAANAALASGHADLVLVPESFLPVSERQYEPLLNGYIEYLSRTVRDKERAHAVVVLAEGVAELLKQRRVTLGGQPVSGKDFSGQLKDYLQGRLKDRLGRIVDVFVNQPRHNIRAVPANAYDQIYCERLGALAVDNALAGYTDFMISQWLTEYVLVPLELVTTGQKSIPPGGMFWKQVVSSTGQPYPASSKLA